MSKQAKIGAGIGAGVLLLVGVAYFLLSNRDAGDIPLVGGLLDPEPATCPLSGEEPAKEAFLERPAVAVKVENTSVAYPLSGLEDAEIVYEELVEGGVTRFMAIFHCNDADKIGPVRSARAVDPSIMTPLVRILGYSGENDPVQKALEAADIVRLDEDAAGTAMQRIPREGISLEHTLYADSAALRKIGAKSYDEPPPEDAFEFGELEGTSKKARTVTINFNPSNTISYEWSGDAWLRFEGDAEFMAESGDQIAVENVLVEEHEVNLSETIVDSVGNPSTEIADETGSGRAVLFRDGRAVRGTWTRDAIDSPTAFETADGETMLFAVGSIWIELVPSETGEVKGSFSFAPR